MLTDCFKQHSKAEKALLVQILHLIQLNIRGGYGVGGGRSFPLSYPLDVIMEDEVYTMCEKKGKGDDSISCHL